MVRCRICRWVVTKFCCRTRVAGARRRDALLGRRPARRVRPPEMDSAALMAAADTTRGKFFTIADADRLVAELPQAAAFRSRTCRRSRFGIAGGCCCRF